MTFQIYLRAAEPKEIIRDALLSMDAETREKLRARFSKPDFRREAPKFVSWLVGCLEAIIESPDDEEWWGFPQIRFSDFTDVELSDAMAVAESQTMVPGDGERIVEFGEQLMAALWLQARARLANETDIAKFSEN